MDHHQVVLNQSHRVSSQLQGIIMYLYQNDDEIKFTSNIFYIKFKITFDHNKLMTPKTILYCLNFPCVH